MNELDIINKKYGGEVSSVHRGTSLSIKFPAGTSPTSKTHDEWLTVKEILDLIDNGDVDKKLFDAPIYDSVKPYIENKQIYKTHGGGDASVSGYTDIYYELFKNMRNDAFQFLEIGIFQGRSLAMWSDYFHNAMINGIDINTEEFDLMLPELKEMGAFSNNNLGKIQAVDSTRQTLENLQSCFRIIIDDGDHHYMSQIITFLNYWPHLCSGGIYIIEDVYEERAQEMADWINLFKNVSGYSEPFKSIDGIANSELLLFKNVKFAEVVISKPKDERDSNPHIIVIHKS